jgi:hypothetical protein
LNPEELLVGDVEGRRLPGRFTPFCPVRLGVAGVFTQQADPGLGQLRALKDGGWARFFEPQFPKGWIAAQDARR